MLRGPEFSHDIFVKDPHNLPSEDPLQFTDQHFLERKKSKKHPSESNRPSVGIESLLHSDQNLGFIDALHNLYGVQETEDTPTHPTVFIREPVSRGEMLFQQNYRPTTPLAGHEYYQPHRSEDD